MHQLDLWKSQLTMALVTASGDTDHSKWMKWLAPSWSTNPNLDALNKVKREYRAIDVKLCMALMNMLKTTGDAARVVRIDHCDAARVVRIEVEKFQRHRAKHDKMLSGREVIAIIFESFRSSDNADVMFMIDNLIHMKYPGDSKIFDFYTQWHTLLEGMRAEDIPPKRTLRDILYKKIRDSTIMKFDLSLYDQFADSDPRKTYDLLMSFIVKRIKLDREKKLLRRRKKRPRKRKRNKRKKRKKKRRMKRKRRKRKRKRKRRRRRKGKRKKRKERRKATSPTSQECPLFLILRRRHTLTLERPLLPRVEKSVLVTSIWLRGIAGMGRIARLRMIPS